VEFIRRNDDVALGLTPAQLLSVLMVAGGVAMIGRLRSPAAAA
jgi:prolipoprotein diacylglyceryltransferase